METLIIRPVSLAVPVCSILSVARAPLKWPGGQFTSAPPNIDSRPIQGIGEIEQKDNLCLRLEHEIEVMSIKLAVADEKIEVCGGSAGRTRPHQRRRFPPQW